MTHIIRTILESQWGVGILSLLLILVPIVGIQIIHDQKD
jgi:hypothetical protein